VIFDAIDAVALSVVSDEARRLPVSNRGERRNLECRALAHRGELRLGPLPGRVAELAAAELSEERRRFPIRDLRWVWNHFGTIISQTRTARRWAMLAMQAKTIATTRIASSIPRDTLG
jgi:hypothetical protein